MRRCAALLPLVVLLACEDGSPPDAGPPPPADAAAPDARVDAAAPDAGGLDATAPDAAAEDAAPDASAPDAALDAGVPDATASDAAAPDAIAPDAAALDAAAPDARTFNCGAFTTDPGWTVDPGFRAVTIADSSHGLADPVALAFARGVFGDLLYVVNQGSAALVAINTDTGTSAVIVARAEWPVPPALLTSITWDQQGVFDGMLYVADQGSDGDQDSRIYRVDPAGLATAFTAAPGPGLDDIYGLAWVPPGGAYTPGLYVSGDTDGARVSWGLFDALGAGTPFMSVPGVEGIAVDTSTVYGGLMYAARPLGGGYSGDGTITAVSPAGPAGNILASGMGGVHAVVFAPGGTYGRALYAASWSTGQLLRVAPSGAVTVVASGLSLTNYDANILDFSPDGNVLFVADRQADRVVCIEPL